jgi:hypothetical protein
MCQIKKFVQKTHRKTYKHPPLQNCVQHACYYFSVVIRLSETTRGLPLINQFWGPRDSCSDSAMSDPTDPSPNLSIWISATNGASAPMATDVGSCPASQRFQHFICVTCYLPSNRTDISFSFNDNCSTPQVTFHNGTMRWFSVGLPITEPKSFWVGTTNCL